MDSDMRLLEEKGKNMVERLSEMRMRLSTMEKQRIDAAAERETVSSDLAATRAAVDSLQKNVAMYAAALEQATKRRRNLNQEVAYISGALRDSQRSSDEETLAYARLRDQIEAASSADAMYVARLARIDEQVQQAASASSQGTKRKKEVEEALAAIRDKVSAAEGQIALSRKSLDAARSDMSEKRRALATAEADLAALRSLDHESENSSALVAALSSGAQANRILCRVADLIEVPATLEAAVEALLGDDLAALVVSCDQDASALVKQGLKSKAKGAATVVVREGMPAPESSSDLPGDPLIEVAEASSNDQAVLWALLGRVRIVSNVEEALQARKSHPELCYICPDATIVRVDGRICFGKIASSEQGALERKRRLRKAARLIPLAQKALTDAETNGIAAEEALNKAQEASAAAKGEQARLSGELSSLNSELGRLSAQADSLAAERKQVLQTQDATAQKVEAARKEIGQHKNAAAEASRKADELSERLKKKGDERASAAAEVHEATDRLSEAKLQLATDLERRNHLQSREAELSHMLSELDQRIVATRDAASSLDVVRLRVEPLHGRYEAIRSCALSWAARLKDRASLEEANSDSLKKTIAEAKRSVEEASDALNLSKEAASAIKLKLAKIEVEVKHAIDAISACGRPLEDALEIAAPRDRKALEDKVENIEAELSGLGPVNEVAMEEYEQLKERSDYIATQVDDLNRARTALRKITAAIERKMRKQFTVVFQQVNENFAEVFSLLFPGGHAYLELTDPEHLESTGVEISAQPRGKKLSKMMLMSGGEKSLTALALLFAVYKTRTVPFYIFDEVEAALDDANLTKLLDAIEQLKKTTQLIVISHQRRTMEQADVLYGVSMRADGVSHVVSQRLDRTTGKVVAA
jgi:chromosome segregation protein